MLWLSRSSITSTDGLGIFNRESIFTAVPPITLAVSSLSSSTAAPAYIATFPAMWDEKVNVEAAPEIKEARELAFKAPQRATSNTSALLN